MKTLFVLVGPTGVGKTALGLSLARRLHTSILNVDSRQIYRDIPIGTAAPTPEQQAVVPHHFVGVLPLDASVSAAQFEVQSLRLLHQLFFEEDLPYVVASGGSLLYLDALTKGIDPLPTIDPALRLCLEQQLHSDGLPALVEQLRRLDPAWHARVDNQNPRRVLHALEVCLQTGQPYSSFLRKARPPRPFRIIKIGLWRPRDQLYERIDQRVDQMMQLGLLDEARRALPYRHCNALQTVGYKELFAHFDGELSLVQAIEKIKFNTHAFARKQTTWLSHDGALFWFRADAETAILRFVDDLTHSVSPS